MRAGQPVVRRWLAKLRRRSARVAARAEREAAFDLQRDLVAREDAVVLDVGANVGRTAKEYRRRLPRALLHCFEPHPAALEALRRRWPGDPRVAVHALALAASEGEATFHVNAGGATSSLLAADERAPAWWGAAAPRTERTLTVRTTTLDAFCAAQGLDRVDVLKLDVQGGERDVLLGGARMLGGGRVGLVYLEVLLAPAYAGQASFRDHLDLLGGHGYALFRLFDPLLREGRLLQTDALFVSPAVLEAHEARLGRARP